MYDPDCLTQEVVDYLHSFGSEMPRLPDLSLYVTNDGGCRADSNVIRGG